jgi:hypothetical protein
VFPPHILQPVESTTKQHEHRGKVFYNIKLFNLAPLRPFLTLWHTNFLANWAVQIDLQPKNRYNRNVDTPFEKKKFSA